MTNGEFELLVKRFEKEAASNSKSYRTKVLWMTGLGFGYVFFFLACFLVLMGISIAYLASGHFTFGSIKLLLIAGALSYFILKALFIKMELPDGYYLSEEEAPQLFARIEELRKKIDTPEIHAILLDSTYNAGVLEYSKFGFIGRKQNILQIGLPLLSTLSEQNFLTVIAHELAHISHSDTAFGAKIYRVRRTWGRLMHSLEENEQFGTFLFRKFFTWYYPRYDAYTFALARQQEYEADRVAMEVTSNAASSLCTIEVAARYFEEDFYDQLFEESAKTDSVPEPYTEFKSKFNSLSVSQFENYLQDSLKRKSTVTDTHPSLMERLHFLQGEPSLPEKVSDTALETLFVNPKRILNHFNDLWIQWNHDNWKAGIKDYHHDQKRFEELSTKSAPLELAELWEKGNLTRQFKGDLEAVKIYEEIVQSYAEEEVAPAYLFLGNFYLENKTTEEVGLEYIEKAISLDWECRLNGLDSLCEYYHQTNQTEKLEETKEELEKWLEVVEQSDQECDYFYANDQYVSHDKSAKEIELGVQQLSLHPEIISAYLIRKVLTVIPERQQYVLALKVLTPKGTKHIENIEELYEKYVHELTAFTDTAIIILNEKDELLQKIKSIEYASIHSLKKSERVS
ncbi:M48 family metalloprotease [Neobacillus sp. NPDC093127]|uniref:M48 family metalloprotease n=1 Tax=Neobacillus sp. NPDC093127 TaxID=3364296 RepID=UPI00380655F1